MQQHAFVHDFEEATDVLRIRLLSSVWEEIVIFGHLQQRGCRFGNLNKARQAT